MTPANPPRKSVRLLETFSLELLSCQKVDHQVCTASFHEVLVASGIVGVCKVQVPEDSLLVDSFLPAPSTGLPHSLIVRFLPKRRVQQIAAMATLSANGTKRCIKAPPFLVFESMCAVDEVLQ